MKMQTSFTTNSMNRSPLRRGFLLIPLIVAVACFGLPQLIRAQCPQICDGSDDTALGIGALASNTSGSNTAVGNSALFGNTTGGQNTARW